MFSTLPMLFVLAVSAVEPDANFFDVPAKEIDWKDAPVIDLDAPSSFPITLQPYQPPKLPAPLKPVTFEHSAVQRRFGEYLFYFDTQTARCVYLTQSSVDQKPREKTTGVFEGYAGDMLTGQVEKIFAFAFKERLTVHFPNAPERLPRVQSCRLSPDGTKMLINMDMDTNAPYIHTSYLVQCENFKPVKVLHAFRKRHFD
ncbi:MAG: hypothetical protein LBH00_09720 [Planctomycetaceae bacterium]|jgi:hypothetical protein|nr:hypothetical protein [Planctomycetaceae bacterium]